jgi:hypothetical protein
MGGEFSHDTLSRVKGGAKGTGPREWSTTDRSKSCATPVELLGHDTERAVRQVSEFHHRDRSPTFV